MSDHPERYASLPCLMHEFETGLASPSAEWPRIQQWRVATRKALLAERAKLDATVRKGRAAHARARLMTLLKLPVDAVLAIYFPIRGELDVLDVAREHARKGGITALPVVAEKGAPLEFWRWAPGEKTRRGFWNIPVPAVVQRVRPDVTIIPLVGFDEAGYRLGYGGGYFDRTLAALHPLPLRIGIGYERAALATIEPQPHDIPMSVIVTEEAVHGDPSKANLAPR